jgi:hypothetical protein
MLQAVRPPQLAKERDKGSFRGLFENSFHEISFYEKRERLLGLVSSFT